ncbi:WD40-repeat-containing domain protein [Paraphysoderma sedebokerense]|nr:WD40-repeat-containing domain protein [Paraphysoderma sedebokerense]
MTHKVDLHYIRFDSPIGSVDLNAESKSKVTIHKFLARSGFSPNGNSGLVMALKLFASPSEHDLAAGKTQDVGNEQEIGSKDTRNVMMLIGYEIGSVAMWRFEIEGVKNLKGNRDSGVQIEARDFQCCWTREKIHKETVLCLDINPSLRYGISGSASNNLQYFKLNPSVSETMDEGSGKKQLVTKEVVLKSNGIADVKIRGDDKILATVGWDGNIRIFSRKSLKLLAVLQYHKEGLQCCAFSPSVYDMRDEDEDLRNVLAVGGKDGKISLWKIY